MIVDLVTLGASRLNADVCIIGAGAAGITIARRLAASGASVVLLEGGAMDLRAPDQALYQGESVGHEYAPLEHARLRYFGGSTNHWTGVCGPLDESDFSVRDWVPHSGWPFRRDELVPYWERAQDILDLGPFGYSAPDGVDPDLFGTLKPCVWRHSPPTRFNAKYANELRSSEDVICVLHANLVRLESTNEGARVRRAFVGTLGGRTAVIEARWFVLACGGIENARLLLIAGQRRDLSLETVTPLVGRFFLEHLFVPHAATVVAVGDWWRAYQAYSDAGVKLTPGLSLRPEAQADHRILNLSTQFVPIDCPTDVRRGHTCIALYTVAEQAPNPDSRVLLSEKTDALGLPVARLDWKLSELDRQTLATGTMLMAHELGRLGLGRVHLQPVSRPSVFPSGVWGASHHMGTTRMGEGGVVNSDGRVHDLENLFIAGSSVFPTGGHMNPTLTVVALALRLADYLGRAA